MHANTQNIEIFHWFIGSLGAFLFSILVFLFKSFIGKIDTWNFTLAKLDTNIALISQKLETYDNRINKLEKELRELEHAINGIKR